MSKKSGEILKQIRIDLNLSQTELGEKLNLPQNRISRMEKSKHDIGIQKMQDFCESLNVELVNYI